MENDILQIQGINEKGFGTIPKLVMQDRRLTIQAKAIYAYFCSYAGVGQTAFPQRDKIISDLGISKDSYYKHFNQLKDYGYIRVTQEHRRGRYKRNIYTLLQEIQRPKIQDTIKQDTVLQDTIFQDNKINNIKNNTIKNNHVKSCLSGKADGQDETDKLATYTELIKDNISYDDLAIAYPNDIGLIDEIVLIIIDAIMTAAETVHISGENKPKTIVTSVLMKLTYEDIEHVLRQFKCVSGRISKKKRYILTMLYNSRMEKEAHYTNLHESNKGKK